MAENNEEFKEVLNDPSTGDEIKMALQGKESLLKQGLMNLSITTNGEYVKITVVPPHGEKRLPHDIIVVMDISGSMAEEALVKNKDGVKEGDGLSYLDLLKHATKTIIMNLTQEDRFCLISYSDDARVEYDLNYMTDEAKDIVIARLEALVPENSTNIWSGIFEALELTKKHNNKMQHQSILLLTDGQPNVYPPAGMIPQLEKYKKMNKGQIAQINTFAIGKHIDTPLLDKYAHIGQGQYCFIPCPGFIGTIFVNTISNILSTMANECKLRVDMLNGAKLLEVPGGYNVEENLISVGDVKFGQRRDIVLKVQFPKKAENQIPFMNVECRYFDFQTGQVKIGEVKEQTQLEDDDPFVEMEVCRVTFVDRVRKIVENMLQKNEETARKIVGDVADLFKHKLDQLNENYKQVEGKPNQKFVQERQKIAIEFITNILTDVTGEVTQAVKNDFAWQDWGRHFLPSLCNCHQQQICNNFCDPGIQKYGGELFQQIKDKVELTFIKLPAPKPSRPKQEPPKVAPKVAKAQYHPPVFQNNPNPQPVQEESDDSDLDAKNAGGINMNNYYNAGGGCFAGHCLVQMADGTKKQVKAIQKGDKIRSEGGISTVIATIEIISIEKYIPLVELQGGLLITPKHPVKMFGEWFKPQELGEVRLRKCDKVYNFVMNEGHSMEINGIVCATLGHGFKGHKVEHPYFGTKKVIEDLEKIEKFGDGFVQLKMNQFLRDSVTERICGIEIVEGH